MTEVTPSLGNYYMMPLIEINSEKKPEQSGNLHILFQKKDTNIQFYVIEIADQNYKGVSVVEVLEITGEPSAKIKINVLQGSSTDAKEFDIKGNSMIQIK